MSKLTMLVAGAAGYVLGTKAGRERYEQIKSQASRVTQDPRVRQKAREAGDKVKENAPVVKDKVSGAASSAKSTVQEKTSGSSEPASTTGVPPTTTSAYPPAPGPVTGVDPTTTSAYPSS